MEEAGTCSRSAVWRRRVRIPPPLRVGRPSPGRFPASAPLALRIGTPDQPSIWTRRTSASLALVFCGLFCGVNGFVVISMHICIDM